MCGKDVNSIIVSDRGGEADLLSVQCIMYRSGEENKRHRSIE